MNPLIVEEDIIARLREKVDLVPMENILSIQGLAGQKSTIPLPCIYVLPDDSFFNEDIDPDQGGAVQVERQNWWVSVHVSHIDDQTKQSATVLAGEIMEQVYKALVGFRPRKGFMPMAYRGRSETFLDPGFAQFPMRWETGMVLVGDN